MGEFLNEYVKDLQTLLPLIASGIIVLVIFSILYDRWMSDLGEKKDGYIAIFVAVGNIVTLLIVAVFSWKAAFFVLIAFVASGTGMIIGDVRRSVLRRQQVVEEAKKAQRRKPLPYRAGRLIADAYDELTAAEHEIEQVMNEKKNEKIPTIAIRISKALRFILDARSTEGE